MTAPPRPAAGCHALALAGLVAAVFVTAGHYYGAGPDYTYLMAGLRLADPSLLERDWYLGLPPHAPVFALLGAAASRLLPLPLAWAALHAAAAATILVTARRCLRALGAPEAAAALFAVASLRWDSKDIGGHALWFNEVHPQALGQALLTAAIGSFLLGRPVGAALAAGAGTAFHPPMGLALTGLLAVGFFLDSRDEERRWLRRASVVYLALALPAVLYLAVFELRAGRAAAPPGTFLDMVRMRLPHHFLPSTWPVEGWLGLAGVSAFAILPPAKGRSEPAATILRRVRFLSAGLVAAIAASWILVEIWPIEVVAKFQLARLSTFLRFLGSLSASLWLCEALAGNSRVRGAIALALLAATRGAQIAAASLLAAAVTTERPVRWILGVVGLGGLGAAVAMQPTGGFLVLLPVLAALFVGLGWARVEPRRRLTAIAAAAVGALFFLWARHLDPSFRLEWTGPKHDFARAGEWIRSHTPRDALFLSPPGLGGFCFFSHRATVVDFHRNPFAEAAIVEWRRRLADVLDLPAVECSGLRQCGELLDRFHSLSAETYQRVAAKYGAGYLLVRRRDDLPFERLHRNRSFDVYRLVPPGPGPRDVQQAASSR